MPNFDGLHEIRLRYTVPVGGVELTHQQTFDVTLNDVYPPGTPWDEIEVKDRFGAPTQIATFITDYLAVWGAFLSNVVNIVSAELWDIPEGTFDAVFVSADSVGGTGGSPNIPISAQQSILTFRTSGGGIMKLYTLEGHFASQLKVAYPTGTPYVDALMAFVISPLRPFVGRDNTPPIAPLNHAPGQNEAVWRKRFRP